MVRTRVNMVASFRFAFLLSALFVSTSLSKGEDWKLLKNKRSDGTPVLIQKSALSASGKKVSLTLVEFSSKNYTLKVVDQGSTQASRKFSNLREAMEKNGCVAGINGGFYGADFKPLGVVYEDGVRIAPFSNSSRKGLASGVIWSGVGGIHIVRREQFKGGSDVKQAIQTGPMLISNGSTVNGLSTSNPRPRSFVLTDWKGTWMIGISTYISLGDLSNVLNSPGIFGDLKVNRAINLDGGRSTGMFVKQDNDKTTYRQEISQVRNFLGIIPK